MRTEFGREANRYKLAISARCSIRCGRLRLRQGQRYLISIFISPIVIEIWESMSNRVYVSKMKDYFIIVDVAQLIILKVATGEIAVSNQL
jgi:hypothetical protein